MGLPKTPQRLRGVTRDDNMINTIMPDIERKNENLTPKVFYVVRLCLQLPLKSCPK